ncbi:MAG TPA: hypothetical protein VFY95_06655 [Sphingomicrobium sp.]
MPKPRITFAFEKTETGEPGELQVYLNPEGRDLLVKELNHLDERWDHVHLQDENWTIDVPLQTQAYRRDREVIVYSVKILFRPDEWDRKHFPHVLSTDEKE